MFMNDNKLIDVKLERDFLLKNLYWTVNKFIKDPDHKQQNSSREDLIGGFFDRWINRIPEYLIFNELLPEGYFPVVDNFIYTDKISKNAPDIIGIKSKHEKYFPFAKFNNNRWELLPDAPFIEMKVFRENQNLITIPSSQFDLEKYYAIVESYVPEDYLISIFCDEFFDDQNLNFLYNSDIKQNFVNGDIGLNEPKLLRKPKDLGGFRLLGIYKGQELYKFGKCTNIENNDESYDADKNVISPIYLKESPSRLVYEDSDKLNVGSFYEYYYTTKSIPIIIEIHNDSEVAIINSSELCISISVNGCVSINGENLDSGEHNLIFKLIFRNGVKYYHLNKIDKNQKEVIFEKDMKIFSGMLFHYGSKQIMVDFSFEIDDNNLNLVLSTENYLTFKAEGSPVINNEPLKEGYNKFQIVAHKNEKSNNSVFYRELCYESNNNSFNNRTRKYSRLFLSIPEGINDFDNECINNPLLDLSELTFEILNGESEIIKKNNLNNFIIAVNGSIKVNGEILNKNLYNISIGNRGNSYFIEDWEKENGNFKHPMLNDNSVDMVDYSINATEENKFIIDLSLLDTLKNNSSSEEDSNELNEENINNSSVFIPISIELGEKSRLKVHEKNQSKMIVSVEDWAKIDGCRIDESEDLVSKNFWKLNFEKFERTSKKDEFILSKKSLFIAESCESELLSCFKKYITQFKSQL